MKKPFSVSDRLVVLVPIDHSPTSLEVARFAASTVRENPNAEIHLLHVVESLKSDVVLSEVSKKTKELDILDKSKELLRDVTFEARGIMSGRVESHLAAGNPWKEILQTATDLQADYIVIGTHGLSGIKRVVLGSVSEQVVRRAHCPVVVVRPKDYSEQPAEIEPACPECLKMQSVTAGAQLWCEQHRHHGRRVQVHHGGESPSFGQGSMFVR